jgi:acyl carrier protein
MTEAEILECLLLAAKRSFSRDVTAQDNFFALGGDSLIAMMFVDEVGHELGTEFDFEHVFEAEDFADLAHRITAARASDLESQ